MGADRSATRRRLTVAQAADELGISVEAVRGRIKRDTLEHERGEDGTVYVLLGTDRARPAPDQSTDQTLLVARLEDEVRFLREELARKDAILLRMAESIPQLEAPSEAPEARVTPSEPVPNTETPSEAERVPWWRRMFGV